MKFTFERRYVFDYAWSFHNARYPTRLFWCFTVNMTLDVTQILLSAQSADGAIRKHAEESLKQFQEQNLPGFLLSLSTELANNEKTEESRRLAGLILIPQECTGCKGAA